MSNRRRCSIGQTPPPHQRWMLELTPPRACFPDVETYSPGWSKHPFPEPKSEQDCAGWPKTSDTPGKPKVKRNLSIEYARKRLQIARRTINKINEKRVIRGKDDKAKELSGQNKDRLPLRKELDHLPARHTTCSRPRGFFTSVYKRLEAERGNRATADKAKELSSQNKDRVTLRKESAVQPLQE